MKKVIGVFTCFNRYKKTKRCIESLMADKNIEWSFVIADDNSTDGTREYLEGQENVTVVKCSGNAFYSGGMRAGISKAKKLVESMDSYDYVMLMNDDVEFYESIASKLISVIEKLSDKDTAILAGSTEDTFGNFTYGGKKRLSRIRPKTIHVMESDRLVPCDTCNGNCVFMPAKVFLQVDNIDEKYIHSLGDYDYGYAATKSGFQIYATNFYVGVCEFDHVKTKTWMDPQLPIKERLKLKEHPLGQPGHIWFHYIKKNYSFIAAVLYTCNDYLKILLKK